MATYSKIHHEGYNRKGKEQGASMYGGLAFLAKEKGLDELSETLLKIATDESNAFERLNQFASQVRVIGLEDATKQIEEIALYSYSDSPRVITL